ncbi:MAG: hypothetical protein ACTSQI_21120 [Candidatus Helarchaeota archaeon]
MVLGVIIQTDFGLPLYIEMFDQKLVKFQQMDTSLTAGFITAMTSFAGEYDLEIGHVKFRQKNVTDEYDYGVNLISMKKGIYLILCFVEPFVYHEVVKEKIEWIYDRILKVYEEKVKNKQINVLSDEEKVYIADILQDLYIKALIAENKQAIDTLLGKLFMKYVGVYGISINSFDNSLLYTSGIAEDTFKLFLNNMGRRSSIIAEYDVIDSYISIPDYQAMRVYAMNPGSHIEIKNIMTNLPEKTVTLYYYLVADPNLDIRPIVSELIELLRPFFSSTF